jgi:hypothetical protein
MMTGLMRLLVGKETKYFRTEEIVRVFSVIQLSYQLKSFILGRIEANSSIINTFCVPFSGIFQCHSSAGLR